MHDGDWGFVAIPEISAIYYGLLQCGYDYYPIQRTDAHIDALRRWINQTPHPFFSQVRQESCQVYPYWPRAALLETAVFFQRPDGRGFVDFEGYRAKVLAAGNIADAERDDAFFAWMEGFPAALRDVMESWDFLAYCAWRDGWLQEQRHVHREGLQQVKNCLDVCVSRYASPVRQAGVLLDPIKCVYSADYHLFDGIFYYSSGVFRPESVVHEFLHHVVHPVVLRNRAWVLRCRDEYPGIDASYYLDGGEKGKLNAFEEYMVRRLTERAMAQTLPETLEGFLHQINREED